MNNTRYCSPHCAILAVLAMTVTSAVCRRMRIQISDQISYVKYIQLTQQAVPGGGGGGGGGRRVERCFAKQAIKNCLHM